MAEPRAKRIKIDLLDSTKTVVDSPAESWLDRPVSEWPEGVIFPVNRGIYARTMMVMGEAKVRRRGFTFGAYRSIFSGDFRIVLGRQYR